MDKDRVKGAVNDAAGRVKRQVGEWTGDTGAQVEGAAQQIKGKAQKVVGTVKDAASASTHTREIIASQEDESRQPAGAWEGRSPQGSIGTLKHAKRAAEGNVAAAARSYFGTQIARLAGAEIPDCVILTASGSIFLASPRCEVRLPQDLRSQRERGSNLGNTAVARRGSCAAKSHR